MDDDKVEAVFPLPVLVIILIALFTFPTIAGADEPVAPLHAYERDEVTVKLMPSACVDGVSLMMVAATPPQYQGKWRAIESNWLMRDGSRKDYAGCWLELSAEQAGTLSGGRLREAAFLLVFSDQTASAIPKREFLRRRGQVGT